MDPIDIAVKMYWKHKWENGGECQTFSDYSRKYKEEICEAIIENADLGSGHGKPNKYSKKG